ncbi:ABC transporter ATP-binding protein [Nocardia sp. CS682]|uniref:ABC transporter ATP-binding protein n=1 Tax=Nocardia sp. CS682 TaxID=1047172 RepID=UPI0014301B49|nr:ABC transporter ATP-binding protein [Nocardia sp. CS682]
MIGIDNLADPDWVGTHRQVVRASVSQAVLALPRTVSVVVGLAWRTAKWLVLAVGFVSLAAGGMRAIGLLATASVFTEFLAGGPTPDRLVRAAPSLLIVVAAYSITALLDSAVGAAEGSLRPRLVHAVENEITSSVAGVDLIAFEDPDFRELIEQGGRVAIRAFEVCASQIIRLLTSATVLGSSMLAVAIMNPLLMLAVVLAALPSVWASSVSARLNYEHFLGTVTRNLQKSVIDQTTTSREFALERTALALQSRLAADYRRVTDGLLVEDLVVARRRTRVQLAGRTMGGVGTGLSYALLGLLLYGQFIELGSAAVAALAMRNSGATLAGAMMIVNELFEKGFHISFYKRLLKECVKRRRIVGAHKIPEHGPDVIRLESVEFKYPGAATPAVSGINITIRRGETVALIGENGSGKSTVAKLIAGLYSPSDGVVEWDDMNLQTVEAESVRRTVAFVSQEPARWPMTAVNNVLIGRGFLAEKNIEAWVAAMHASGAGRVVERLDRGEETLLSRKFREGVDLSAGQWQRFGIARGIYARAPVLIADEPTSALDARAEADAFDFLMNTNRRLGATTVLVTHRLSNVCRADQIVVLDRGRIVEIGTHKELMEQSEGIYRAMFEIQSSGFENAIGSNHGTADHEYAV